MRHSSGRIPSGALAELLVAELEERDGVGAATFHDGGRPVLPKFSAKGILSVHPAPGAPSIFAVGGPASAGIEHEAREFGSGGGFEVALAVLFCVKPRLATVPVSGALFLAFSSSGGIADFVSVFNDFGNG